LGLASAVSSMNYFRKHWQWFTAGIVALSLAVAIGIAAMLGVFDLAATAPVAEPRVSASQESAAPDSDQTEKVSGPVDIAETRTMKYSEVWNPPDEGEFFWQIVDPDKGYPEGGGTTYVLAHACERQTCTGDAMRTLKVGDTLSYKGTKYRVDSKDSVMKDQIGDLPIWTHVPGRLVLVTCIIETTWEQSDKNEVIVASPAA